MIRAIVAVNALGYIGLNNDLMYSFKEDMNWFKKNTVNSNVIMGRKTFESMGSKQLPKRLNIVLTRSVANYIHLENENLNFCDIEHIVDVLKKLGKDEDYWIIGGEEIYKKLFYLIDEFYVTHIADSKIGDKQIPNLREMCNWKEIETVFQTTDVDRKSNNPMTITFKIYRK